MRIANLNNGATPFLDFSGSIATGGTAQLVVPQMPTRTYLLFQNTSDTAMYLGLGGATATVAISSGATTTYTVTNAGFGYLYPPIVRLLGGAAIVAPGSGAISTAGSPFGPTPTVPGVGVAVVTSTAIASITNLTAGSGYVTAPKVYLENDPRDPYGCFLPAAGVGIQVAAAGAFVMESSVVSTDALSVFCATTGKTFTCKVAV